MRKTLTILVPTMKMHSSVELIFPRLQTANKELVVVGTTKDQLLPHIGLGNRILIRWGSYYETADIADSVDYNSREAIIRATNKSLSRKMLSEAGVPVPRVVTPDSEDIGYPLIARPRFHSLGQDLIVIQHREDFVSHYTEHAPKNWYYSEFVDKVREFRVHVGHGKILCILEKPGHPDKISWNRAQTNLSAVLLQPVEWDLAVIRESIKAVKAIQMDFAGVDVIVDRQGKAYVIELNTTPLMLSDTHIQEQYARYFDWLAESANRRPHFEIASEDPADYAWGACSRKLLTILLPGMRVHPSMESVFPKLKTRSKEFVVATKDQEILPHIDLRNRIMIRWGSTYKTVKIPGSVTYNSRISTMRANNKSFARKLLADAGVNVPRAVTPHNQDIRYPVIARPQFHSLGENFVVIKHHRGFIGHYARYAPLNWYYSEYVDKVREFRVNVAHGKILSILEVPKGNYTYNWNRTQTDILPVLLEPEQWNLAVIKESMKAVNALRLDFAGVDVMVDQEGIPYIIELNPKPGMSSTVYTQDRFAAYFDWLAASNTRRPHFHVASEDPLDYAWEETVRTYQHTH